jgi:hypothetical protein
VLAVFAVLVIPFVSGMPGMWVRQHCKVPDEEAVVEFAPPRIIAGAADSGGAIVLRSAEPLGEHPVSVVHSVREWARLSPDHPLIAERAGGDWRTVTYGAAVTA